MTRTQAIRTVKSYGFISSNVFNQDLPHPFRVEVNYRSGMIISRMTSDPARSRVELSPRQLLSFIKRNFPRKA